MYSLVKIGGSDAALFLQGQLTQDLNLVRDSGCLPGAWLDPRGRVIATLRILRLKNGFGLVVSASIAESFVSRLGMYRLRADVSMEIAGPEWISIATDNENDRAALRACDLLPKATMNACSVSSDLHAVSTGAIYTVVELFGDSAAFSAAGLALQQPMSEQQWRLARIQAGNADIGLENTGKYTAHMLNLDLTAAVSFDKGCYTGQEIVARTEHRGRSKRRMMCYHSHDAVATIGDKLWHGDHAVGEVVNAAGTELLAVIPLNHHGEPLELAGKPVEPVGLPYNIPADAV